jgi:hypothetical protein
MSELRVSDADRERIVDRLRVGAAEGRLDQGELEERLDRAFAARTEADLERLVADLPRPRPASTSRVEPEVRVWLAVSLLLVAVWAATGLGYFWPVWPILGWGIPLLLVERACSRKRGRRQGGLVALR